MHARDAIRRTPTTVDVGSTIRSAAERMDREGVGAVLVTDEDRLVGIVTDRDLVVRGVANGVDPHARIDSMMSTDPTTISATAELSDALEVFRTHPFRRLPVLDGGAVIGMLSVDDIVIDLAADLGRLVRPVAAQVMFASPQPSPPANLA